MPQGDPETPVTACVEGSNDTNFAGETLADEGAGDDVAPNNGGNPDADAFADAPPESFWLSKDAEYDWFDRNAFYQRKESTRGNSNSTNLNPIINPSSHTNSQRFSVNLKSKASIIGLPKTQKTTYVDSKRRNYKPANIRLFPKRSESVGKTANPVAEPSSPKVSCMGRVRSKRGRRRSNSSKKNSEKSAEKSRAGSEKQSSGFCCTIMSMIRCIKGHKKPTRTGSRKVAVAETEEEATVVELEPERKSISIKLREIPVSVDPVPEPPGLGGIKRFASGRRSGSWTAEELNQAISQSLEIDRRVGPVPVAEVDFTR